MGPVVAGLAMARALTQMGDYSNRNACTGSSRAAWMAG